MNDHRINELVRMAMEAEELEHGTGHAPMLRLVGAEPEVRVEPWFASRKWWIGAGVAAAAVIALGSALPLFIGSSGQGAGPSGPIAVAPQPAPGHVIEQPLTIEKPLPTFVRHQELPSGTPKPPATPSLAHHAPTDFGAVEKCVVVSIYRDNRGGVPCVKWRPQEWIGNKCLSEVTPQEIRTAASKAACPEAERALVVAMAGPQKSLPKSESDAVGLASCIMGTPSEALDDLGHFVSAASGCIAPEVSVKIEAVSAR